MIRILLDHINEFLFQAIRFEDAIELRLMSWMASGNFFRRTGVGRKIRLFLPICLNKTIPLDNPEIFLDVKAAALL
jgi:hypothetical protein